MSDDKPVCRGCGGSGLDDSWAPADLSAWKTQDLRRWKRQERNRPRILEGYDRFLGHDEQARISHRVDLADFCHETLKVAAEINSRAGHALAMSDGDRGDAILEVLDAMFAMGAEITHYLANRGHPVELADVMRIAEEQKILREIEDALDDPDSGLGE